MNLAHGTDPIEGSSLAISILEAFFKKSALTIATTHYPEIKNYALITNGFENASSEFDLENLKPTYQLLIGIPGRSNAFAISKKLGLPIPILERAKSFMNSDEIHIEELLKNIYDDKISIEKDKKRIEEDYIEIENLKKHYENQLANLQEKETSILENARLEARKTLMEAKENVRIALQEIHKAHEYIDANSTKTLNDVRNELNIAIKNTSSDALLKETSHSSFNKEDISIGMEVYVSSFKQHGTITSLVNKSGQVQVQIGSAKIMIPFNCIEKANLDTTKKKNVTNASYKTHKSKTISTEIKVIGYTVEEAIFVIDKYLDDCALAKLNTVRIVHGKGTGTLRNGIHSFLKKHPHVKNYRFGTYGEGEMGVTIVELD